MPPCSFRSQNGKPDFGFSRAARRRDLSDTSSSTLLSSLVKLSIPLSEILRKIASTCRSGRSDPTAKSRLFRRAEIEDAPPRPSPWPASRAGRLFCEVKAFQRQKQRIARHEDEQQGRSRRYRAEQPRILPDRQRVHSSRREQTHQCAPQMGVVADVAQSPLHSVKGDQQIRNSIEPRRNVDRQEIHPDATARKQKNVCEYDARHSARGPQRPVVVMPMRVKRQQVPSHHRPEVNAQKLRRPEDSFDQRPEKIQARHVHQQMPTVEVQKPGGDEPVVLSPRQYRLRPEQIVFRKRRVPESAIGKPAGQRYHRQLQ